MTAPNWDIRDVAARTLAVLGVLAYNWWVVAIVHGGFLTSVNSFFSDLEASGRPDAWVLQDLDLLAGALLFAALLLRGRVGRLGTPRAEWAWLLGFTLAEIVGAIAPYSCPEATSRACRSLEWHFYLPPHHYVHIVAGICAFASITAAALIARRRTSGSRTLESRVYHLVVGALVVGYPFLGLAYLSDRDGAFVEPIFFLAFSALVATEVFEPAPDTTSAARRVAVR